MKEVGIETFRQFLRCHKMQIVGHASPMPQFGYGDDRTYYEGNGKKAEYRVVWGPSRKETFLIEESDAARE